MCSTWAVIQRLGLSNPGNFCAFSHRFCTNSVSGYEYKWGSKPGIRTFTPGRFPSDVSPATTVYGRFPESHFPGKTFPGKTFPGKSFSQKNTVSLFYVKQTLTVFCVNWRIILVTGLLSLIREVMPGSSHLYFVSAQRPSICSPCRAYLLTASNVK